MHVPENWPPCRPLSLPPPKNAITATATATAACMHQSREISSVALFKLACESVNARREKENEEQGRERERRKESKRERVARHERARGKMACLVRSSCAGGKNKIVKRPFCNVANEGSRGVTRASEPSLSYRFGLPRETLSLVCELTFIAVARYATCIARASPVSVNRANERARITNSLSNDCGTCMRSRECYGSRTK